MTPEALAYCEKQIKRIAELEEDLRCAWSSARAIDNARMADRKRWENIELAAQNLVNVKGRFHTEQAFEQLKEALK